MDARQGGLGVDLTGRGVTPCLAFRIRGTDSRLPSPRTGEADPPVCWATTMRQRLPSVHVTGTNAITRRCAREVLGASLLGSDLVQGPQMTLYDGAAFLDPPGVLLLVCEKLGRHPGVY